MINFIKCSKILYDKEIIEKNKEINYLKKHIIELKKNYGNPIVEFDSLKQFNIYTKNFESQINNVIKQFISKNDYLKQNGLSFDQCIKILNVIYDNLLKITHNKEWSSVKSQDIVSKVNILIETLISCGIWYKIYESENPDIVSIIYNLFILEIGNFENSYNGVIDCIAHFKCKQCNKFYKYGFLNFNYSKCIHCTGLQ